MAILRKEEPQQQAPVPITKAKPKSNEIIALLGHGSEFEGKLTFKGTVRIDGKFKGEIFSDDTLIIGEGAEVRAKIDAGIVIIHGNVIGDTTAKELVELHSPARVYGKLITPNLVIERGVVFQGECQMENIGRKGVVATHTGGGDGKKDGDSAMKPVDIGEE